MQQTDIKEVFSAKLRGRMGELGLSYKQLSDKSGVPADTIGKYARAEQQPSGNKVVALARALDCDPNTLLGWGANLN